MSEPTLLKYKKLLDHLRYAIFKPPLQKIAAKRQALVAYGRGKKLESRKNPKPE